MGKTAMKKAGELEAVLEKEMSDLVTKLKGVLTPEQKAKMKSRLHDLEKLLTGEQEACAPCSGGTRFFPKKK